MTKGMWASNTHFGADDLLQRKMLEGGTGFISFGFLASLSQSPHSGTDDRGLAWWTYMEFSGTKWYNTMLLVGPVPCRNNKILSGTTYHQHRQYFFLQKENRDVEPNAQFLLDLLVLLSQWKAEGKHLVVCLDVNEYIYKGALGKILMNPNRLNLHKSFQVHTTQQLRSTYFWGSKAIDGIWVSDDISIANVCALSIEYGVEDHRMIVLNIHSTSMVGTNPQPLVHPGAWQLNSEIPSCFLNYNTLLQKQLNQHCLYDKLIAAHLKSKTPSKLRLLFDNIDNIAKDCMLHAKKKCRKL